MTGGIKYPWSFSLKLIHDTEWWKPYHTSMKYIRHAGISDVDKLTEVRSKQLTIFLHDLPGDRCHVLTLHLALHKLDCDEGCRRTTTAEPTAITRMVPSFYSPEIRAVKSPPPAFATSGRVMSGAKDGSPITPKSIIRILRPFFSINSLEWPIIDLCPRQF